MLLSPGIYQDLLFKRYKDSCHCHRRSLTRLSSVFRDVEADPETCWDAAEWQPWIVSRSRPCHEAEVDSTEPTVTSSVQHLSGYVSQAVDVGIHDQKT